MDGTRALAGWNLGARGQKRLYFSRNAVSQLGHRMAGADQVNRVFKGDILFFIIRLNHRPQVHTARQIGKTSAVADCVAQRFRRQVSKGRIDKVQNRRGRAKGIFQRQGLKGLAGGLELALKQRLLAIKATFLSSIVPF